ncbi:CLUMA_CG017952, isoform A [Clunio marinus]|uniref:CLUMA_CG017952, isoform A n=1 Tax=Clunio marinus TaxID=568069 RepID=A0A1J1IXH4_9DIPT|nr:CLUMA_CG017952, isoform A [Clunio marinus]
MCPFRYLYHVLLFILSNAFLTSCVEWKSTFDPNAITIKTASSRTVRVILSEVPDDKVALLNDRDYVQLRSENEDLATVKNQQNVRFFEVDKGNRSWDAFFDVTGVFLGQTRVFVEIKDRNNQTEKSNEWLDVTCLRPQRVIDRVFTYSVVILVTVLYINFGAAINMSTIKDIMRKPIGPAICFACQFVFMPLAAYGLGLALFPDFHELALGLFFTGISPGGGASNMWTLLLGGNINLSIAMTTISTLAAFAMMPLWIFTLGSTIFERAELGVPYQRISTMAAGLLIPLAIGLLIQRYMPKIAKILVRILKPLSLILILFIVIFAIVANLYIFQLFSWQIILAGLGLPWLGYSFGWLSSKLFRQSSPDAIAIAIETGIQNTGIAIFLLTFSLEQPMADLTTVVPVSVAIMTPFPLLTILIIQKCKQLCSRKDSKLLNHSERLESEQNSSLS